MAVVHLDAADLAIVDEYITDARVGKYFAATTLDPGDNALCDLPAASHRVETAVQVVPRDHGMRHECGSLWWQSHVAPLAAQYRNQVLIPGQLAEDVVRVAKQAIRRLPLHEWCRNGLLPWLQHPAHAVGRHGATDFGQKLQVSVDGRLLIREHAQQVVAKLLLPGNGVEYLVSYVEAVVFRVHRRPLEIAFGKEVE
jgi:hypothetical protein